MTLLVSSEADKSGAEILYLCLWSLMRHGCVLVICQANAMSALNGCHL